MTGLRKGTWPFLCLLMVFQHAMAAAGRSSAGYENNAGCAVFRSARSCKDSFGYQPISA